MAFKRTLICGWNKDGSEFHIRERGADSYVHGRTVKEAFENAGCFYQKCDDLVNEMKAKMAEK